MICESLWNQKRERVVRMTPFCGMPYKIWFKIVLISERETDVFHDHVKRAYSVRCNE